MMGEENKPNKLGWTEHNWKSLVKSIEKRDCILMLGCEIPVMIPEEKLEELGEGLGSKLIEEFKDKKMPLMEILSYKMAQETAIREEDDYNLAEVAENYVREPGKSRNSLEHEVEEFYDKIKDETRDIYTKLASLPFKLIITSSPDNFMYNALREIGKNPFVDFYNFKGGSDQRDVTHEGTEEEPLVYLLYGSIDNTESLVLSENDLLEFLAAVISGNPSLSSNIKSEIVDKKKSFLFLGFGLKYWYLRVLLHALHKENRENPSFAIEKITPPKTCARSTIFFYQNDYYKIHIHEQSELDSFVENLYSKCKAKIGLNSIVSKRRDKPPTHETPTVFICHANEDKKFAYNLSEQLEASNIQPWLDKKILRGGDKWRDKIKRAIKKEINYFFVLQSKNLLAGYRDRFVNREIKWALERQETFRSLGLFIVPLKIDDCESMEEFEDLQTIDLSSEVERAGKIRELVKKIINDFNQCR